MDSLTPHPLRVPRDMAEQFRRLHKRPSDGCVVVFENVTIVVEQGKLALSGDLVGVRCS